MTATLDDVAARKKDKPEPTSEQRAEELELTGLVCGSVPGPDWPACLPDGSFTSVLGRAKVRIIEAQITVATTAGARTGTYRLATTLLDAHRYPAFELVTLYHQRWEIESAYFEIKKSMLGRHVLRARTLPGITQEIYALLTAYQVIRIAIADATSTVPAPIPTGPASPSPCRPPATSSSRPRT